MWFHNRVALGPDMYYRTWYVFVCMQSAAAAAAAAALCCYTAVVAAAAVLPIPAVVPHRVPDDKNCCYVVH